MEAPLELLKKIDILSTLTGEELQILHARMKTEEVNKGEALFHEGDAGDRMYIVVTGKIAISVKLPDGGDLEIAEIGEGNFFGEMSIIENVPRSATCLAKENAFLLSLAGDDFFDFIEEQPQATIKMMYRMLNIICQRLQKTGAFLSDMVQWGEKARKRAITDEFTGLYNRRFLDDALDERFSKAEKQKKPLSLVMVDLDHFGELNREYGEKIGDKVILSAAAVFKRIFSEQHILSRYGGDEFTFVLSDTPVAQALNLCRKVVREMRKIDVLNDLNGRIKKATASIGIASFPEHAENLESLKEKTDKALYKAKEDGRDRASVYGP